MRVLAIVKHKWVKKVAVYAVAIVVGSLYFSWIMAYTKKGAYSEFRKKEAYVDMDCFNTLKKPWKDEV
ncbi:MAG: hypothetical protein OYH77_01955 [Pseudomonadota bacterium]|nr:hypothetical protein [Pseudomonadota bacterium]